ncbi:MAG: hypothetical protein IZT58_14660 [Actinobacteria bacterium]|nr:hypothetical protein [Actinomycetota bacterium]
MTENDSAPTDLSEPEIPLSSCLLAEGIGSAFLVIAVIGSVDGWPIWLSEVIATIGLLLVIHAAVRHGKPYVVAPESAPMFIAIQIIGALIAFALIKPLFHHYRND